MSPLLPLAAAAWGLGCAVALATLTIGPPHPGQLPGGLLLHSLDARTPMRMMLLAMAGPFAGAFLFTPLLRRLTGWSCVAAAAALASGLWMATVEPGNVLAIVFLPIVFTAAAFLARGAHPRFTRRDLILVPLALTLFALLPLPVVVAAPLSAAIVIALRIALAARIERLLIRHRRSVVYLLYPLFCLALAYGLSFQRAEGAPRLDIFEDGHWLMPADAMMRGETPYRDVVPGHGFISDGLLEYTVMRLGAKSAGSVLAVRQWLGLLNAPLLYAVALALTGSAEAALLAVIAVASMLLTGTTYPVALSVLDTMPQVRAHAALAALACCLVSLRRRDPRPLAAAGALSVLAGLTSVDYGAYAAVIIVVTILRFGRDRVHALAYAGSGAAALGFLTALAMAIAGCLGAFLRVTFLEIPRLTEAYALQFFWWPQQYAEILGVPDALAGLFLSRVVWVVVWVAIAIGTAAAMAVTRPPHRSADRMIVAGAWVVFAAMAFAERAHVNFMPIALVLLVGAIYLLRRNRTAFAIASVTLAVACTPTPFLVRAHDRVRSHGSLDPWLVRYEALPRAHGAWIDRRNAQRLALLQSVTSKTLSPGDTFLDFANMPGLYYLLDRRCPIRFYEVVFYEDEALQREVIAALEHDVHVRLAVMQFTNRDDAWIDNVPNSVRAPLVYAWLQAHFQPLVAQDGVVIWIRR